MVPLADMFNTENEYNAQWGYEDLKEGFVVSAKNDIKEGE